MITVVGAGFAGVEAAWAIASRGEPVRLYEMRPGQTTPAHTTGYYAELVCSNSFKSKNPQSPAGELKLEMLALGSLVIQTALEHEVPGGEALCVDRDRFGEAITAKIKSHPLIEVAEGEWNPEEIADEITIIAAGPLATDRVANWLAGLTGRKNLYFYDAVSPTVDAHSIDRSIAFEQSRYDKGGTSDYLNCPFNKDEYEAFVIELVAAERTPIQAFETGGKRDAASDTLEDQLVEKIQYFSGCMPIEAIAERGSRSLAFGNFKPVGLIDPRTGRRPYAALQLRPENSAKTLYSLVACQNRLRWAEQKRVFRMVPGLESADFVRFGVIHRNTYIQSPEILDQFLRLRNQPQIYVAGQLTGVEGYVESAAMGIYAGIQAIRDIRNEKPSPAPRASAFGSLLAHLQDLTPRDFAPMNINWGLFPEAEPSQKDKGIRRERQMLDAREAFNEWRNSSLKAPDPN